MNRLLTDCFSKVLFTVISTLNFTQVAVTFSLSSPPSSFQVSKVPRINSKEFDKNKHYFHSTCDKNKKVMQYETPVLIENLLSQLSCEEICDSLVTNLGDMTVDVQRKQSDGVGNSQKVTTNIYQCTLNEALNLMMQSQHNDSFFCFSEGLLDEDTNSSILHLKQLMTNAKEKMFENDGSNGNDDNGTRRNDIFDYFPKDIKPSDCVIIAGEGATSTLHRDPFSWTGTSFCLEGTKVWRFIAPPGALAGINIANDGSDDDNHSIVNHDFYVDSGVSYIDNVLDSYRLPSIAWHRNDQGDDTYLSSGWQSDFSLYSSFKNFENFPSAEELANMDEDKKMTVIENLVQSIDELSPNCPNSYVTTNDEKDNAISIWTVVQKPGDLLVIPAYWWHQTFALEPSVALASQRCDRERDYNRVFKHILDTSCEIEDNNYPTFIQEGFLSKHHPEEAINQLFNCIAQRGK